MRQIVISLTLAGLAAGCGRAPHEPAAPVAAVPVIVVEARRTLVPGYVEAGGTVSARETAVVSSRILAPVVRVLVRAGDRVRAGQPLVRLDDRALSAEQARGAAAARAAEHGRRGVDAGIAAARAGLDLARVTHERVTRLHERRSATDSELDQSAAALAAAQSRLEQATAAASQADASLESATAAATAAAVSRSWATITSPFAGLVTDTLVDPGSMAVPGAPLLRVETRGASRVEVRLDASRAMHLRAGDAVSASIEPQGREPLTLQGRVAEVSRAVQPGAQTFLVKIDLPDDASVTTGTFARVRFAGRDRDALVVPRSALTTHGQLTSVFVVEGDRTRLRLVTTGSTHADLVEVTAGLVAGERVVQSPAPSLAEGVLVAATRPAGVSRREPSGERDSEPAVEQ
jgi:RND family efflux transporter MFP subunit